MNQAIIDFYKGIGTDSAGRKIEDIWLFDDIALENVHNYVQWIFPLQEPSYFNKDAPLLDDETMQAFRESGELQDRVLRSLEVMLRFLHLKIHGNYMVPYETDLHWLTWKNHNYRRLTRMITSLRLLGLTPYAKSLHGCVIYIANETEKGLMIDDETMRYWDEALEPPPADDSRED